MEHYPIYNSARAQQSLIEGGIDEISADIFGKPC